MATRKPAGPVGPRSLLTVEQVREELQIPESTWNNWRAAGKGPHCIRLPNGTLRVRRGDLDSWLEQLDEAS